MSAKMVITITEDEAPDGHVEIDFDVEGFDIESARVNGDLPPAVLLGAAMIQVADDLPQHGGRVAPPSRGQLPGRRRH